MTRMTGLTSVMVSVMVSVLVSVMVLVPRGRPGNKE